jgi:putative oxidoreductase
LYQRFLLTPEGTHGFLSGDPLAAAPALLAQRVLRDPEVLTTWLLRIAVAVAFIGFGVDKFRQPFWIQFFARLGFGQWFRSFTGVVEIVGGVLVLVPGLTLVGLAMLACTMVGAALAWMRLGLPGDATVPAIVLVMLVAIGWSEYNRAGGNDS